MAGVEGPWGGRRVDRARSRVLRAQSDDTVSHEGPRRVTIRASFGKVALAAERDGGWVTIGREVQRLLE